MAAEVEKSGLFQSIWVGDSLLVRRRPESISLLSAIASHTFRVRLGIGCMASFPVRNPVLLAAQLATLDAIAGPGRLVLAACIGGRTGGGDWQMEDRAFGVTSGQRVLRLEEGIRALRLLWTEESATFQGDEISFEEVALEPRPVTTPHPPIWIAVNPRPFGGDGTTNRRAVSRIARLADGWMVSRISPRAFSKVWQEIQEERLTEGQAETAIGNCLYYNANINDDRDAAFAESKRFFDDYYDTDWPEASIKLETAYGPPEEVISRIGAYIDAGVEEITFRLTSYDQPGQLKRLTEEVLPAFV